MLYIATKLLKSFKMWPTGPHFKKFRRVMLFKKSNVRFRKTRLKKFRPVSAR